MAAGEQRGKDAGIRTGLGAEAVAAALIDNLHGLQGKSPSNATRNDWYMALAYTVRDRALDRYVTTLEEMVEIHFAGDEVRRTQQGNNNAYCHDSESVWFDWRLLDRHPDVHRFVKMLNAFRQRRDVVVEGATLTLNQLLQRASIEWHGVELDHPDWGEHSHSLAFTLQTLRGHFRLHGLLNAFWEPLTFQLPPLPADAPQRWRRCIDTALASPDDIYLWQQAPIARETTYVTQPRSVVILALSLQPAADDRDGAP